VYPDALSSSSDSDNDNILETRVLKTPRGSANAPIAPHQVQLGSFLNRAETEIRSSNHATVLTGLLELGRGHPDGITGAFGHNNRISWFRSNIVALFCKDGPLGSYVPVSANVLVCHVGQAQVLARSFYDRDHSNEQSGAAHKDVPKWARCFFQLFQATGNQITNNAVAAATRNERQFVVASLVGGQAPLGFWGNASHAQMRNETSRNNNLPQMRQQIIGEVNSERLHVGSDDSDLVKGRDDIGRHHAAPRCRILNGVHRRNIHIGFSPERNNPSSRLHDFQRGYASLDTLTQAVVQSFASTAQGPPRQIIDIAREYQEATQMLASASGDNDRMFYNSVLPGLSRELVSITSGNQTTLYEEE
jgi:hypothetical protein